jgi:hypothetical protein
MKQQKCKTRRLKLINKHTDISQYLRKKAMETIATFNLSIIIEKLKICLYLLTVTTVLSSCGGSGNSSSDSSSTNTTGNPNATNTWEKLGYSSTSISGLIATDIHRYGQDVYLSFVENSNKNLLKTQDGNSFTEHSLPDSGIFLYYIDETGQMYFSGTLDPTYTSFDAINFNQITTGEIEGEHLNGNSNILMSISISGSVYTSTDQAMTWTKVDINGDGIADDTPLHYNEDYVLDNDNGIKPAFNGNNTFILLGSLGGLLITNDAGATLNEKLKSEGNFFAVTGNSQFPNDFYAAKAGKIFKSTDSANTWSAISSPLLNGQSVIEFRALELLDDGILLAWGLADNAGQSLGQVFKSDDSGMSWSNIGDPIGISASIFALGNGSVDLTANTNYYFLRSETTIYKLLR